MDITVNKEGNVELVALKGNLDISTSQQFDEKLTGLINGGPAKSCSIFPR